MDRLIYFKSVEAAMDAVLDGVVPTTDAIGIVKLMRPGQRCDVTAFADSKKKPSLTVRIAPVLENSIQTGQLVRLAEDAPSGYVATARLSSCYEVATRRFLTAAETMQAEAAERIRVAQETKQIGQGGAPASTSKLDHPVKRIGAMILALGLLTLGFGLFVLADYVGPDPDRLLRSWWYSVSRQGSMYERSLAAAWGTYLAVVGYLMSFGYDLFTKRLVNWIRTGSTSK